MYSYVFCYSAGCFVTIGISLIDNFASYITEATNQTDCSGSR